MKDTHQVYDQYIRHMTEIRALSTPSLDGISNAESYSTRLRENFVRIGILAAENRSFLDDAFFPILHSEEGLSHEQIAGMEEFCEKLLNAEELDNLDPVIASRVAERLLNDSRLKEDFSAQIREMDIRMSTLYTLLNITDRISEYPEISMKYRKAGIELGEYFISLRQYERFAEVPDSESRELILTNSRFATAFFENLCGDPEVNQKNLQLLEDSMKVCDDPFYPPLVPDYDWHYFRFRLLSYYAILPDFHNARGFDGEQLSLICDRTEELWKLWHEDPERYREFDEERYLRILLIRNRFLAGRTDEKEYLKGMLSLYAKREKNDYEIENIAENILIPTEIMCVLEGKLLGEDEKALLVRLYNNVVNYAFLMPNSGILSYMLEYITHFLRHFIEIPGKAGFEDTMLNLLAAMHPPTYVHSRMVAEITACLCRHLIDIQAGLFLGVFDLHSEAEIRRESERIIRFAYHAALCHDAGKLFIIDTVFVYGRKLEEIEFDLIKTHPKMGAEILSRYPSTAPYAQIALGHHKWFDNSRGYPEAFDPSESALKVIIDIVSCADCMDAATDSIGRSYSCGKTLDEYIAELNEGSGSRYASWLSGLFSREEVKRDMESLLKEGREQNYRNTYELLKTVQDEAKKAAAGEAD